jgi:hypothetical protein
VIAGTATLLALAVASAPAEARHKIRKVFFQKARVVSDGFVTPGQLETIAVSRMPPRTPVRVVVEAPPFTIQCGELYFCDPAPTAPAPGTPPYRTSGKGRALLTFVMPANYYLETDPFRPSERQPVYWMNGQAVHIDVDGFRDRKGVRHESFGFARAVVQLPPPSS